MEKKPNSKKPWIWIITGILLISGIGLIAYLFWPKKSTENKLTEQTTEKQSIQAFRNQVQQIKQKLNHLENKNQQKSLETRLTNLENKLNNLSQQNNSKQVKIISGEIQQEIKEISEELGLNNQEAPVSGSSAENPHTHTHTQEPNSDLEKEPNQEQGVPVDGSAPENSLVSGDVPQDSSSSSQETNKRNSNFREFQVLRSQTKELITELDKLTNLIEKQVSKWKTFKFSIEEFYSREIKDSIDNFKSYLDTARKNKELLEGYASEKDYQTFLSAGPETQKANLDLIEDTIKHSLKSSKEYFEECLKQMKFFLEKKKKTTQELKELWEWMNSEGNISKPSEKDYNEMMEKIAEEEKKQTKQKASLDNFEATLNKLEYNSAYLQNIRKILKEVEELYQGLTINM